MSKRQNIAKKYGLRFLSIYEPRRAIKIDKTNIEKVAKTYFKNFGYSDKECIVAILLNGACMYMGMELLAVGTHNVANISLRDLLRAAIVKSASKIILIHNHPSTSIVASYPDTRFFKRVRRVLSYFEIKLEANVIMGGDGISVLSPV